MDEIIPIAELTTDQKLDLLIREVIRLHARIDGYEVLAREFGSSMGGGMLGKMTGLGNLTNMFPIKG